MTEPGVELTIVVPTFQERDNIAPLVARLDAALAGGTWEVVFVDDDSPDGTAEAVRALARNDRRVRVIQRLGRRGLSGACVEGILSSSATYVAVMDADLQHDESVLPEMLRRLRSEPLDLVVGSRYVPGASTAGWDRRRLLLSQAGIRSARALLRVGDLRDTMSGFFMLRREAVEPCLRRLSQQGFKVLLDILASAPRPLRFVEIPYRFAPRQHGQSKLGGAVAWEFSVLLLDKFVGRFVPARFLLFCLIGASGVVVHLGVLAVLRLVLAFHGCAGRRGAAGDELELCSQQRQCAADLCTRGDLVAGGPGRCSGGRGVELRGHAGVHLAPAKRVGTRLMQRRRRAASGGWPALTPRADLRDAPPGRTARASETR